MKPSKEWTNVKVYTREEYLSAEEFKKLQLELKQIWKKTGWLHLRMQDDIDTKNSAPLSKPVLRREMQELQKQIEKLMIRYLEEKLPKDMR